MISPETLKKHNLKAVLFSCIGEGETFMCDLVPDISFPEFSTAFFMRVRGIKYSPWADGTPDLGCEKTKVYENQTVYVPVWRVTSET